VSLSHFLAQGIRWILAQSTRQMYNVSNEDQARKQWRWTSRGRLGSGKGSSFTGLKSGLLDAR